MAKQVPNIGWDMVAKHLAACHARDENGEISWSGRWLSDCMLILASQDSLDTSICAHDRHDMVWRAINEWAKSSSMNGLALQRSVRNQFRQLRARQMRPYVYVAQVSLAQVSRAITFRMRGATVTIGQQLPGRFDRAIVLEALRRGAVMEDISDFAWARVHVRARTAVEAQARASDSLDFYRAALNFALVGAVWEQFTSDESQPLNVVLLGPSYSLHEPSGRSASEMYWYDPWFKKRRPVSFTKDKRDRAHGMACTMRRRIATAHYGDDLYRLMIRYCRALDNGESEAVLLRLWGLLETLTGTIGGHSDELVRRAAALFRDSDIVRGTMEALRDHRNRIAHVGTAERLRRDDMIVMHRVVAQAIQVAFQKSSDYSSLTELGHFLSLPGCAAELQRGIKLRRDALRFHGHR